MSVKDLTQKLYYMQRPSRWSRGIGAELPEAYKKFWREWKLQQPEPVHYIKKEGSYERDEKTGEVRPVQNIPLLLRRARDMNTGIWGGESVVQGFVKKDTKKRRVPRFWTPKLKQSVVYSEILNKYMSVVITNRTVDLIHSHRGFDTYILSTPACDLNSELAVKLKREMLLALSNKTLYEDNPEQREVVYDKYKGYLDAYTKEEIDWYGLNYVEACRKFMREKEENTKIVPLKIIYRQELLKALEEKKLAAEQKAP